MNDIECPYCGHEYSDDAGEIEMDAASNPDSRVREECPKCEKEFEIHVEWDPCFYTSKIEGTNE